MISRFCLFIMILNGFAGKCQFFDEKYTTQELLQKKEKIKQLSFSNLQQALYLKAVSNLASRYNSVQKFDSSITFAKEALYLAENQKDNDQVAASKFNLGYSYHYKGLFFEASKYYEEAIISSQLAKDDSLLALSYYLGGMCYNDQKEYKRALKLLKNGYFLCEKYHYVNQLTRCLNNIGIIYNDNKNTDSALFYFKECLKVSEQNNIERMIAISYKNVGKVLLYSNSPIDGVKNIEKSIMLFQKSKKQNIRDLVVYCYFELAKYYDHIKDIQKANKYALQGVKLNETLNYTDLKLEFNNILYQNYKTLGHTKEALLHLEMYLESSKKINENFLTQQHSALEERFKSERQNDQINFLNKEKIAEENKLNILIICLIVFSFFIFFVYSLYRKIKKQKGEIEAINQNLEAKVEERTHDLQQAYNEIKEAMLNGQTIERKRVAAELHDNLGSILSAIGMSMEVIDENNLGKNEKKIFNHVRSQIDYAYKEVRLLSHNLQSDELEKYGLKKALENLQEKVNDNQILQLILDIQAFETLTKEVEFNLYSICLELINNTLKHAEASEAKIEFSRKETSAWRMKYSDNGKSYEGNLKEGFGLQSIKNRVQQIGGTMEIKEQNGLCFLINGG